MIAHRAIQPWAFLIGIVLSYRLCLIVVWAYLPSHNPITKWFLETYAGSNEAMYYLLISIHDTVVNILLALPFAFLISKIRPDRRWLYVTASVLVIFLWEYRLVLFVSRDFLTFINIHGQALFGVISTWLILPFTMLLLTLAQRTSSTS